MVATVSPSDDQYHHTVNTLKYADRAKEVKTHIHKNIGTIDTHVADYQRMIDNLQVIGKEGTVVQALRARRQTILDNIRDNYEAGACYKKEIEENEKHRCQLQSMIDEVISNNGNKTYLHILSQYRLLGMANMELQFEIALRDQVIHNQCEAQRNLWNMLLGLGLDQKQMLDLAAKQGITIEDWSIPRSWSSGMKHSRTLDHCRLSPFISYHGFSLQTYAPGACVSQHHQDFSSTDYFKDECDTHNICREEHHSSYLLFHDHSTSGYMSMRKHQKPGSFLYTPQKVDQDACNCHLATRTQLCACAEGSFLPFSNNNFLGEPKEPWLSSRKRMQHIHPVEVGLGHTCRELPWHCGTKQAL